MGSRRVFSDTQKAVKPDTPTVLTGKPVGRVGRCQGHVLLHILSSRGFRIYGRRARIRVLL
jgi:hypothetical protein